MDLEHLSDQFRTDAAHEWLTEQAVAAQKERGLDFSHSDIMGLHLPNRDMFVYGGIPEMRYDSEDTLAVRHNVVGHRDSGKIHSDSTATAIVVPPQYDERRAEWGEDDVYFDDYRTEGVLKATVPTFRDNRAVTDPDQAGRTYSYDIYAGPKLTLHTGAGSRRRVESSPVPATAKPAEFYDFVMRHASGDLPAHRRFYTDQRILGDLQGGRLGGKMQVPDLSEVRGQDLGTSYTSIDNPDDESEYGLTNADGSRWLSHVGAAVRFDPASGKALWVDDMGE